MKTDEYFKSFTEAMRQKIPERGKLADMLTDILGIEKESVYRRLRGSVPFSFAEVSMIAIKLGFSLDSITEGFSPSSKSLIIHTSDYIDPTETDYKFIETYPKSLQRWIDDPDFESGSIGSIIPVSLCVEYQYIYKFYLFKWAHQFKAPLTKLTFDALEIKEKINEVNRFYIEVIRQSPKTTYILDRNIIKNFVNDILYFYDVRLLSQENLTQLKDDLHLFLNNLEKYAIDGEIKQGKPVGIYLANIHFDASYSFVDSNNLKMTLMRSFAFSDAYSLDETIFRNMKNWLNFLKRTSTPISTSNVMERMRFFEQQREIANLL
jgi:hypothetical protein